MNRAVKYTAVCANVAFDGGFIGGKIVSLKAYTAQEAVKEVEQERGVKVIAIIQGTPAMPWRRS